LHTYYEPVFYLCTYAADKNFINQVNKFDNLLRGASLPKALSGKYIEALIQLHHIIKNRALYCFAQKQLELSRVNSEK